MKIILTATVAAVLLAGCTVPVDDTSEPATITETATPAPVETHSEAPVVDETEPALSDDDLETLFLITVREGLRENFPDIDLISDAELLEVGKAPCGLLDSGVEMHDIYAAIIAKGVDPEFGGVIVGAGVVAFCPEYQDEL